MRFAMKKSKRPTKEHLLSLYTQERLTDSQIAQRFNVSPSTVWRWRKKYGIELDVKQLYEVRLKGEDT
jgi:transposase